ncbi:F-box only protein 9 [Hyposmocoma kahamanoa]|uniref:F-box only protein 9 n=1 Tax=Hyposmocoma kahamanoa TaxID=1477025 RepID=UPI000E6D9208|nr:F-box only protein 9 [Hyposmocoma kahamanoa]
MRSLRKISGINVSDGVKNTMIHERCILKEDVLTRIEKGMLRTWGIECSTPRALGFDSWRQMYVERPRLQLHGCYISKTTYLRHGENAYQDTFYRPWYLIDYFRYLRFFPEGLVLMWTTADEPIMCVPYLKHRTPSKPGLGIMSGHYRLMGKKVLIVVKKSSGEKKTAAGGNSRFRARRKDAHEPYEQTFHLELELRNVRRRRNHQLIWTGYAVSTRRDQWTTFELSANKFPPFSFSLVRNYSAEANAPLPYTHAYI